MQRPAVLVKRNRTVDDQAFAAKLDLCKKMVLGIAQNIRLGRIATEPKDCKSYCSFKGICRIDDYKTYEAQRKRASSRGG